MNYIDNRTLSANAVLDTIDSWIQSGQVVFKTNNQEEDDFFSSALDFLVSEDFQPKRVNVVEPTAVALLSICRDHGFNVKFEVERWKHLFSAFSFNVITDDNLVIGIEEV